MALYLADTSIWAWAEKDPTSALARKLAERMAADEVGTSPVVVLEVMHRARGSAELEHLQKRFALQRSIP